MKDKETPPIVFRYEERIAELEKENEQLKRINTLLADANEKMCATLDDFNDDLHDKEEI